MKIDANGTEIRVMGDVVNEEAYISLTDIAKYKNPDNAFIIVANWMRNQPRGWSRGCSDAPGPPSGPGCT